MKMKHNKKLNTAFIYEAIITELAKAIHEGDKSKKSTIIRVIRENFGGNSLLSKDLELYKSILETKDVDRVVEILSTTLGLDKNLYKDNR